MGILSHYDFSMMSTPPAIQFGNEEDTANPVTLRAYNRIYFKDSIFSFYPYAEVFFRDSSGLIPDRLFFVEGLELATKLGSPEVTDLEGKVSGGYLEHTYVWSESQINNIVMSSNISGDVVFLLISKYAYTDIPQSKSFNYENAAPLTIDQMLITDIIADWNLAPTPPNQKLFISTTTGFPYVNQCNMTNRFFIEMLSEFAYSASNATSPFYTFINSNGEFYFMTLQEMLNQPPVMTYKLDITQDMMYNEEYIKSYTILHGGMPVNFKNYKKKFYNYDSSGVSSEEAPTTDPVLDIGMASLTKTSANEKLLIRRQNISNLGGNSSNEYFGIQDETNNAEFYKGYKNGKYKNSNLSYRMVIVVQFNPKIVSGKTISIAVQKQTKNNEWAQEYAGNWLICESKHLFDKDGVPYTQLTISKPRIAIDGDHPFINDFD